jgi:hypothetical protein
MRAWWVVFALIVGLAGTMWLRLPPGQVKDGDLTIYQDTVSRMRAGTDYYEAMTDALTERGVGPASMPTAYRLPTAFVLWQRCCYSPVGVLAVVVVSSTLVGIASSPILGGITLVWLLYLLHPPGVEQWGFVEVWALPLAIGSIVAVKRGHWRSAAALALGAACVRELCAIMLIGGVIAAWRARQSLWPWLAAGVVWVAFVLWHISRTSRFIVDAGRQQRLLGTGSPRAMLEMAGPLTYGIAFAAVAWIVWRYRRTSAWWLSIGVIAGVPLIGLVVYRAYWGILVLPLALAVIDVSAEEAAAYAGPSAR